MFLVQVGVAVLVALSILSVSGPAAGGTVLGPVLAAFSLVQCAVGVVLAELVARPGSKGSALAGTLLGAVLLASPAWFLMLALVTGQEAFPLIVLGTVLICGYGLGFILAGRFARRVVALTPPEPTDS